MSSSSRENYFKLSHAFLLAIAVIPTLGVELGMDERCKNTDINDLCSRHETCDACIQAHPCCNFCYEEDYKGLKCNNVFARLFETHKCPDDKMEKNFESNVRISEYKDFTETTDFADMKKTVQIRPQKFEMKLRRGEALNITFEYKPVADYPLELYFLADLSVSMLPSLEYMKKLGDTLKSLSRNYKIAYGSFMDKPGMPFQYTDEQSLMNPCFMTPGMGRCDMGYLFKHRLNFTRDMKKLNEQIQDSQVTANIDDLDGALDAILQILVCGKKIDWSENSRKIILLATDSFLHTAGDGILVGAVERPTEECLLDDNGNHSHPLKYDYPTVEQIVTILRQKKVNIIFAVKKKFKLDYYEVMSNSLLKDYGFVGQLEEESAILDLIKQGYNNFSQQVSFFVNFTNHEHLDVKLYADCDNTGYNETSTCYGVKNQTIKFIAEIRFKNDDIVNDRDNDTIYIEEKNIHEKIEISISYVGNCKCEGSRKLGLNCSHGKERCGKCSCDSEWTGEHCDRTCSDDDLHRCRKEENDGTISKICSRNGECNCGICECTEPYSGTYCEFKCPSVGGKICDGHGKCEDGKCFCNKEYQGESCSCSKAMYNCDFDGKICSGQGECHCNECKCDAEFSGKYCELSNRNNTICDDYSRFLADTENYETGRIKRLGNYDVQIVEKTSLEEFEGQPVCEEVFFNGNYRCTRRFSYSKDNTTILLPYTISCTMTVGFGGAISVVVIIFFTVLAGLLGIITAIANLTGCGIMFHKWRSHRQDQLEDQGNCTEMEPL